MEIVIYVVYRRRGMDATNISQYQIRLIDGMWCDVNYLHSMVFLFDIWKRVDQAINSNAIYFIVDISIRN